MPRGAHHPTQPPPPPALACSPRCKARPLRGGLAISPIRHIFCLVRSQLLRRPNRSVLLAHTRSHSLPLAPTRSYSLLPASTRSYSLLPACTRSYSLPFAPDYSHQATNGYQVALELDPLSSIGWEGLARCEARALHRRSDGKARLLDALCGFRRAVVHDRNSDAVIQLVQVLSLQAMGRGDTWREDAGGKQLAGRLAPPHIANRLSDGGRSGRVAPPKKKVVAKQFCGGQTVLWSSQAKCVSEGLGRVARIHSHHT